MEGTVEFIEEEKKKNLNETIYDIWRSRKFQIGVDVCRILLVIIAALILYKLIVEIESVKILANDPCRICESKTGASCFIGNMQSYKEVVYPKINLSDFNLTG